MTESLNSLEVALASSESPGAPAPELNSNVGASLDLRSDSASGEGPVPATLTATRSTSPSESLRGGPGAHIKPSQITPEWPEERIRLLISLWSENWSASQIGDRLGASRNSVLGKINRLGLSTPSKPSPKLKRRVAGLRVAAADSFAFARFVNRAEAKRKSKVELNGGLSFSAAKGAAIATGYAADLPIEPGTDKAVSIHDLTNETCRFPVSTETGAGQMFCGVVSADLASGRPYCPWHHSKCFVTARWTP